eukprot:Opistho-1_new@91154
MLSFARRSLVAVRLPLGSAWASAHQASYSSHSQGHGGKRIPSVAKAVNMDTPPDASGKEVFVERHGQLRHVFLNRPKALNSLNTDMVKELTAILERCDDLLNAVTCAVILDTKCPKAFCAGGDVRLLAEAKNNISAAEDFFRQEYNLNFLIHTLKKPFIAYMNGITMGGGVGVSVHGRFRVATERTVFAMPETAIGLFPDVGGSYILSRMDGALGMYLGLTGAQLRGSDCYHAGIATDFMLSSKWDEFNAYLRNARTIDDQSIAGTLMDFADEPGKPTYDRDSIDECFGESTIEGIYERLREKIEDKDEKKRHWAIKSFEALQKASPTSLKVTHELITKAKSLSLADCLRMEFRLALRFMQGHDFFEGVRARLIVKDNKPLWNPPDLASVTESHVSKYFEYLGPRELVLPDRPVPTRSYALLKEERVRALVTDETVGADAVFRLLAKEIWKPREKEHVEDAYRRCMNRLKREKEMEEMEREGKGKPLSKQARREAEEERKWRVRYDAWVQREAAAAQQAAEQGGEGTAQPSEKATTDAPKSTSS